MTRDAVAVETSAVRATSLKVHDTIFSPDPLELSSRITRPTSFGLASSGLPLAVRLDIDPELNKADSLNLFTSNGISAVTLLHFALSILTPWTDLFDGAFFSSTFGVSAFGVHNSSLLFSGFYFHY